jgi:hypothetical protein
LGGTTNPWSTPCTRWNYRKEGEFLLNKANQYATWLATSNLNTMDTFIFPRSIYVPLMMYSLPVTTLAGYKSSEQDPTPSTAGNT